MAEIEMERKNIIRPRPRARRNGPLDAPGPSALGEIRSATSEPGERRGLEIFISRRDALSFILLTFRRSLTTGVHTQRR
jgi:hypothetical protein